MNPISLISPHCLKISGDVTFDNVQDLNKEAQSYLLKNPIAEIDLSGIKNCDSAALLLLLNLWRQSRLKNCPFQYLNLPAQLVRLMNLSNLNKLLTPS